MPKQKADPWQVIAMCRIHTNAFVADRLGISTRQVRRILADHGRSKASPGNRNRTLNDKEQLDMMEVFRAMGESYAKISRRFGISRQAVQQKLNETTRQ